LVKVPVKAVKVPEGFKINPSVKVPEGFKINPSGTFNPAPLTEGLN
jgi:hypothetical protein